MSLTEEARKAYKDMVSALEQEQAEEALKNDKKVPHHMGHSRNHSAASAISFCSIFSEPISEVNEKEYGKGSHIFFISYKWCVLHPSHVVEVGKKLALQHSTLIDATCSIAEKIQSFFRDQLEEYGRDV